MAAGAACACRDVCQGGIAYNKPDGICGEAASDTALATVFARLGILSLSMSARAVPAVRGKLSRWTRAECRAPADYALGAVNPHEARHRITT